MSALEIVTAAIEGTGLKIAPYHSDNPTPTVTLPIKGGTIMLATIVGDTLRSSISVDFTNGRRYDPGFRHAIRSVLAAEAALQCCSPLTPPAERTALSAFVARILEQA